MPQNIYDDPSFFNEYIKFDRQTQGLDGAPEWEVMKTWVPTLKEFKVLDLGCGFGWICRWARRKGAASVRGIDLSLNMLSKAKEFPHDPSIIYEQGNLDDIQLPSEEYHVVFSSLTFHYLVNLPDLIVGVYQTLKPGGTLIFSVEHPTWTAPVNPRWIEDSDGNTVWPLERYLDEGPRISNWLAEGVVKQHRRVSTYINILLGAGFTLAEIDEWGPTKEQLEKFPDWSKSRDRPPFLLIKAVKPAA